MIKDNVLLSKNYSPALQRVQKCFLAFALCFSAGAAFGAMLQGTPPAGFGFLNFDLVPASGIQSFFVIFTRLAWFHFLVVLLSASVFGFVLLPFLCLLRGYALACSAATIITMYPNNDVIMTLVILGIPTLFSIPCFFALSLEGFFSSLRLARLSRGQHVKQENKLILRCFICIPFLVIGALLQMKLVPLLITTLG